MNRSYIPKLLLGLLFPVSIGAVCPFSFGADNDWPQWMGPHRNNVLDVDSVSTQFPSAGLRPVWSVPVGNGYAGPAVAQGKVFVTDLVTPTDAKVSNFDRKSIEGKERISCFDDAKGELVWRYEYPVTYSISYPSGPRCTPLIDQDRLYTLGAEGHLFCFERETGKVVWSKDLKSEYKTDSPLWGFAAHPLIDGDRLYTLAGGEGSHTVCLDKHTGKELWRSGTEKEQGYVPPSIIEAGGVRQLIVPSASSVRSVDPTSGKEYWRVPYDATNGSIIMTPVRSGDFLFIGGYSKRNMLLQLDSQKPAATVVWQDLAKKAISPVNVQPIIVDDIVYGFDETGELIAFEIATGKRLWETSKPVSNRPVQSGTAFIVRAGEHFYLFNDSGELIVADLSPKEYKELARTPLIEPSNSAFGREVVWCAPAYARGHIYVRNDEKLIKVPLK